MRLGFPRFFGIALLAAGAALPAAASEGSANLFLGQKWYAESDWQPIEEQPEWGLQIAFGQLRAPIHFALEVLRSEDDDVVDLEGIGPTKITGVVWEYGLGVRKVFRRGAIVRPHLGAGAILADGEIESEIPSVGRVVSNDSEFGLWIDGGVTWRLAGHLNLGVELRYSRATLEFGDIFLENKLSAGGLHAGALIGYGW